MSREAAGLAQAPPRSAACTGAAALAVLSQLCAASTKAPPDTGQSTGVRHKHPACACLNNLCYLNQYLPVNYQPAWKQGSCDPQQSKINPLGARQSLLTRAAASCSGEGLWCCLSPVSHHQSPGAGVHGAGCSPMGLPYKGGPIKRPLHISIYKAHQRDEQQRGWLPLLLTPAPPVKSKTGPQDLIQPGCKSPDSKPEEMQITGWGLGIQGVENQRQGRTKPWGSTSPLSQEF